MAIEDKAGKELFQEKIDYFQLDNRSNGASN